MKRLVKKRAVTYAEKIRLLLYQNIDCSRLVTYLKLSDFEVYNITDDNFESTIKKLISTRAVDICVVSHYSDDSLTPLTLIKQLNEDMPVIMLSDKSMHEDIIEAFDNGADDYIARPYNIEILIRRIKAKVKHLKLKAFSSEYYYELGSLIFDVDNRMLLGDDVTVRLTKRESAVLLMLCAHMGCPLDKQEILARVYGYTTEPTNNMYELLSTHISYLRKRFKVLEPRVKITIPKYGFVELTIDDA